MVTTRKKPRISYVEEYKSDDESDPVASTSTSGNDTAAVVPRPAITSTVVKARPAVEVPEDDDNEDGDVFTLTGRNYQKKGPRKKKVQSLVRGKPAFDHSRILELPADVLCTVLSHVPLENLYYVSISSKKLSAFLHSKSSASIWIEARRRLTVYAPKNFLSREDYSTVPPSDPLLHFEFRKAPDGGNDYAAILEKEMELFEDEAAKLPLAVPSPPAGVSEFSVVRYLFCTICYHCEKERGTMIKVPELLAHFCKSCFTSQTCLFKTALSDFEAALITEDYKHIPDYTRFLMTLPSWRQTTHEGNSERDQPLPPKERRIYIGDLTQKNQDYLAKKESMTTEEFDAWFVKTIKDHDDARRQVGSLSEYLWLKNTYTRYRNRMTLRIHERNEKAIKEAILERMVNESHCNRADAEKLLQSHPSLFVTLAHRGRTLDEEAWEKLKPRVEQHIESYKQWLATNPLMRYPESAQLVTTMCQGIMLARRVANATSNMKLDQGHLLSLPKVKEYLLEQPADMTITERRVWISTKVAEAEEVIESDLIALCHTIKKDLVRKLLLKDGKSVAKLDSFTSAKLQELLDKPEVYFTCTQTCNAAKKTYNWIEIANHACTANSMGEKNYGDRRKGLALTACIPVGWQPDVIELAEGFKGLYTVVEAVARAKHLASGVSLASNPFSFPSSQSAIVSDHRWKMKCALTTCWTGFCRLNDILPHLAKHLVEEKTTLKRLGEEDKPIATVPYASAANHYHPDYSDEYDSDEMGQYAYDY